MRFLLIGLLIVVLFVGSFFAVFTALDYLNSGQHGQPSGNTTPTTPVPTPADEATLPPDDTPPTAPVPEAAFTPASSPTAAIPLSLDVTTNQPQYRIGDKMTVTVSANQACHLYLYDVNVQGVVARVFPNSRVSDPLIQPDVRYRVPGEADEFDLEMTAPAGNGHVHALCVWNRVEELGGFYQTRDLFRADLQEHVYTLPAGQWTEMQVDYRVVVP